jgi:hypothetical protein
MADIEIFNTNDNGESVKDKLNANFDSLNDDSHIHANKALLDTYAQTEADLADSVSKKHSHSNQALLDQYAQTEANLSDALNKRHNHSNQATLDTYDQTNANITDAIAKKHAHANQTDLDNVSGVNTGDQIFEVINVSTSSYSPSNTGKETYLECDAALTNITLNLPSAVYNTTKFTVNKNDTSANTIAINFYGSEKAGGHSTIILQFKNSSITLISDGSNWILA